MPACRPCGGARSATPTPATPVECFVDELLQAAGKDPVAGRLEMMTKHPRAGECIACRRGACEVERAGSGQRPRARRCGGGKLQHLRRADRRGLDGGSDGPRVHKVWCAVDCGVAVNPDVIRAQIEGGIGYGLGHVLFAEVTLDQGRPVQTNFDTYRSLRINEMPEVEVAIVPSTEKPTGVGEPGVPPIGPAVANAMARLGLGRPRQLPFVKSVASINDHAASRLRLQRVVCSP